MSILKVGSSGKEVYDLQWLLKERGYSTSIDGIYGKGTKRAVANFQTDAVIPSDGIVGPVTLARLTSTPKAPRLIGKEDVIQTAHAIDVSGAHVMAVLNVESAGEGFLGNNPIVRFERHVFFRELSRVGIDPNLIMAQHPDLCNKQTGGYKGGSGEWERLNQARAIHEEAALSSASWGLFQIMGYHWRTLGLASLKDFVNQMSQDESHQLSLFGRFIRNSDRLTGCLQHNDWAGFALSYNGAGYAKNQYDVKLQNAFNRHSLYF